MVYKHYTVYTIDRAFYGVHITSSQVVIWPLAHLKLARFQSTYALVIFIGRFSCNNLCVHIEL